MALKESTMTFILAAELQNSFNKSFSGAESTLKELQKQVESYNKVQSDISAYEKQEAALKKNESALQALQQKYDNIQKEMEETGTYSSSLANKQIDIQQKMEATTAKIDEEKSELERLGTSLEEAGVDTGDLKSEQERLEKEFQEVATQEKETAEQATSFGDQFGSAMTGASELMVSLGLADAVKEVASALSDCIDTAAGLESTMSTVEALSGATTDELEALNEKAKELGATTQYTATESAEAMTYMAMAGWDASDMISGMDGVIQLASASGEDLATVSDIVTDALTAFGLSASDTSHFADVLAQTASSSNTSVTLMGDTFKNVASIAGTLGYSIEDVSTMIGLMANNGIKGSNAGTALKNTMNGLVSGVTLTSEAFGEYEFSAVNADGTMKDLQTTISELRYYFDQMTQAEQVANAQNIAGTRTYNGLLAILNSTDEEYEELTDTIYNCTGAAQEMAETKLDNLNGQLTLMQSAWDALKTTIGEQFMPVMQNVYKVMTNVFGKVDEFIQENPAIIKGITAMGAVLGVAVVALTGYTVATKLATAATKAMSAAIPGLNVIVGVTALLSAFAGVAALVVSSMNEGVDSVADLTTAASELEDTLADAQSTYDDTVTSTEATAAAAEHYIQKLQELEEEGKASDEVNSEYQNTIALLLQTEPDLEEYFTATTDGYGRTTYAINESTDALMENVEAIKQSAIASALQDQIDSVMAEYGDALVEYQKNSIAYDKLVDEEADRQARMEEIKKEQDAMSGGSSGLLTSEYAALSEEYNQLASESKTATKEMANLQTAMEKDQDAADEAQQQIDLLNDTYDSMVDAVKDTTDAEQALADQEAAIDDLFAQTEDGASNLIDQFDAVCQAYDDMYNTSLSSIQGQFGIFDNAEDKTEEFANYTVDKLQEALDSQVAYWQQYSDNISILSQITAEDLSLTQDEYDTLMSYVQSGNDEAVALADSMVTAVQNGDYDSLTDLAQTATQLGEIQEQTASDIADWTTDLSGKTAELTKEMTDDINELDLSSEAAQYAKDTIQSYVDGLSEMAPAVQAKANSLRNIMSSALTGTITSGKGYATGTDNASKGLAWVGENGPELVYFNGGEQVMDADETEKLLESLNGLFGANQYASGTADTSKVESALTDSHDTSTQYIITVSPVYNITGSVSNVQDTLDQNNLKLKAMIKQTIDEIDADKKRRAYV